jgi:hypothetical protein
MSDIVGIAACLLRYGGDDVTDPTTTATPGDDVDDGARTGTCLDGPLSGQELTSRYPNGALICDRPAGHLWIYDWTGDGFKSRGGDQPMPLVEDATADDNRWRAADEGDYDVIAAPWVGDAGQVDAYADQPDNNGEG